MDEHPREHDHRHEHDRRPTAIERHADVAIIGASAAGLAAALQLGRQRRAAIVVDSGEPRNAPAAHMHSYLGHEGLPPAALAAIGREEVRSYGGEVIAGRAVDVTRTADGRFRVELAGGHAVVARRVLAATGLVDELPAIEGLAEHWGGDVVHCPFCHGYEVRDQRVVQVVTHSMDLHVAELWRQLTARLTVVLHDGVAADHADVTLLRAAGVTVLDQRVARIVTGADGRLAAVELVGGERVDADAVAVGSRFHARVEPFRSLGLDASPHPTGLGDAVTTDALGETSVPGLYAAGNVTDPRQQVLQAAANGSQVGAMISSSLAREDLEAAARPSANEADWDRRYGGNPIWSGNPNGTLVREVTGTTPGRALDVGAGEGGDAVWLAEQGWRVTASDISTRGLDRVAGAAAARGLAIECLQADANAEQPFPTGAFDLVTAHYASIPRTPDGRGITGMLAAVAPGGTLLVVGHDLAPMRTPVDTHAHSRPFDPDAYVRVDDVAAAITGDARWHIDSHETRPRPPGAVSSHHVDDVVLRATRRA
jgi:thioredoxin reductase/SAM-dependent methyltransferase